MAETVEIPATLTAFADVVLIHLREHFSVDALQRQQVMNVVEEAGELVGAYRRYAGFARRSGPWGDVEAEMADVIICAYVTAATVGTPEHFDSQIRVACGQ